MATRTIGGIAYNELTATTLEMDAAIMREVRSLGIESFETAEGETPDEFLERIITSLIEGGQAFRLLGCFLLPIGKEWTRDQVQETAEIFRHATDPNDKAQLRAALIPYLFSFFAVGLVSQTTSRKFSAVLRGILGQPEPVEALTSASGTTSPASLPVGILRRFWRWLVGRFAKRFWPTSTP